MRPLTLDADGTAGTSGDVSLAALVSKVESRLTQGGRTPLTIGWLYAEIARAIVTLDEAGEEIFVGDPERQLVPTDWPGAPGHLYRIADRATALLAIYELVRQGEGTSLTDPTDDRKELAHYFRFQEIVEGRQLVHKDDQWVFEGPPITFEPDGVFPMVDDPDTAALPPKSAARAAAELFDTLYGDLLRSLQGVFNGSPRSLGKAVGLMYGLEIGAQKLMSVPVADGAESTVGPAFQPR